MLVSIKKTELQDLFVNILFKPSVNEPHYVTTPNQGKVDWVIMQSLAKYLVEELKQDQVNERTTPKIDSPDSAKLILESYLAKFERTSNSTISFALTGPKPRLASQLLIKNYAHNETEMSPPRSTEPEPQYSITDFKHNTEDDEYVFVCKEVKPQSEGECELSDTEDDGFVIVREPQYHYRGLNSIISEPKASSASVNKLANK